MNHKYAMTLCLMMLTGAAHANIFYIDLRSAVVDDEGNVNVEELFVEPIFEASFYQSALRTLPPPGGTVLIENETHASLITGVVRMRNNCRLIAQNCSGEAIWRDTLSFDATGIPAGETVTLTISADFIGSYGISTGGMRYWLYAQSATSAAVVDTLTARVSYFSSTITSTADPSGFTDLQRAGTWLTYGPDRFVGQLLLQGGFVNTIRVETELRADTENDVVGTFDIQSSVPLGFTSASGVFLSGDADQDGDGIVDVVDNCTEVANAAQRDTDNDGIGNFCDADFDNNCVVNTSDLGYFRSVFFSGDALGDLNGDGTVNAADLGIMKSLFFLAPGPSGRVNACDE